MSHPQTTLKKYISPPMILSSFTGMVMALPLVFALSSSATGLNGSQNQSSVQNQSSAQVTQADFAKFAYAYDQGYQAHTVSASSSTPMACSDATVTPASSEMGGSGSVEMHWAPAARTTHAAPHMTSAPVMMHHAPAASMVDAYNSYYSTINNSSSVTNTNSNNTVGSNNMTKTEIDIKDSKGVMIDNSQNASLVATNDSYNKDSYNTKADSTVINDSYNQVKDSNNTSTETSNVTMIKDSYNTENETENSNNTTDTTNTSTDTTTNNVTNTETTTIDSYNSLNVDGNIETGHEGGNPYPSVS